MKRSLHFAFIAALLSSAVPLRAQLAPAFENLTLIDEIDIAKQPSDPGLFREYPEGISQTAPVLSGTVRLLPNDKPGVKYFGYLLGKGKDLKAGEGYVLEVVYPEDAPRSMFVMNMGCETTRGFHTGQTTGDVLKPKYVNSIPESLEFPLSKRFETWQELFFLHDRFPSLCRPRGQAGERTSTPETGFWVYIGQFAPDQDPLSQGAAVSKIRLYKAPALESYSVKLNLPPPGLPQRHITFREEMADDVLFGGPKGGKAGVQSADWYEYKARLMKFLGMNTFSKDLLEFGFNQGWDSAKYGGNDWVFQSQEPKLWSQLINVVAKYDINLLPYYEYSGSRGRNGLGKQQRAVPLSGTNYTHVKATEPARADLTDPETFEDFRKMLEITMVDVKDKAHFVGAWLRPRPSQLPISFSDNALALFVADTKKSTAIIRDQLVTNKALYDEYISWWHGKRKEFLNKVRDYIRQNVNKDAIVLYTADTTETGWCCPGEGNGALVAEDPKAWKGTGIEPVSLEQAMRDRRQFKAMTLPMDTWSHWEWQHAAPQQDPENYHDNDGVLPTFSFNRAYTVADAAAMKLYETPSGLAMVRHYCLNENMFREEDAGGGKPNDLLGYFVADMEYAGPYSMFAEARAVANGDPRILGYLSGNSFNRGFPQYARNFNAAFLSLPGMPSVRLDDASSDAEVVVRKIDAGEHGAYLAVVNTGYQPKQKVTIKLPVPGKVINAATGQELTASGSKLTLDLYPFQLVSLRILKH